MNEFKAKGFFVDEDGVKSTELAIKKGKFKKHITQPNKVRTALNFFSK